LRDGGKGRERQKAEGFLPDGGPPQERTARRAVRAMRNDLCQTRSDGGGTSRGRKPLAPAGGDARPTAPAARHLCSSPAGKFASSVGATSAARPLLTEL